MSMNDTRSDHNATTPDEEILAQRQRYDELLRKLGKPANAAEAEKFLAEREIAGSEEALPEEILTAIQSRIAAQKEAGGV